MENTENNRLSLVNVIPKLPEELVGVVPEMVIATIDQTCQRIDDELVTMKMSMIEIGKCLLLISTELSKVVSRGEATPLFEKIVHSRFGRKKTWAYQAIAIYEAFGDADPLYEMCSSTVLRHFTQLDAAELEPIRTAIEGGTSLSAAQAKSVVKLIVSSRGTGQSLEDLQEELAQAMSHAKTLEKAVEAKDLAITHLKKDVDLYQASNDKMFQDMREKQGHLQNYVAELEKLKAETIELKRQMDEERKAAKSKMQTVEVPVAPPGYTSIEDAIQDIEDKLAVKQDELARLDQQIQSTADILNDEKSVSSKITELFKNVSQISIAQHEMLNRTRVTDLQKHRDEVEKIAQMLRDASDGLMRAVA